MMWSDVAPFLKSTLIIFGALQWSNLLCNDLILVKSKSEQEGKECIEKADNNRHNEPN